MDSSYYYVVCSHDGLDPDDVREKAESKCLASAAKLAGVSVTIRSKTVQSLTGVDSSEIAEIEPLSRNVKCEWIDRYLEKVGNGFRCWLKCRVAKKSINQISDGMQCHQLDNQSSNEPSPSSSKTSKALMIISMVPQADRLIVSGESGERVIEVKSNLIKLEISAGDKQIIFRKQKYKDGVIVLKPWKQGDVISKTVYLEQEFN